MAEPLTVGGQTAGTTTSNESSLLLDLIEKENSGIQGVFEDADQTSIKTGIKDLVDLVLKGNVVGKGIQKRIASAIALLDKAITDQVNEVLHHPEFQKLESAWRGLDYMVKNSPRSQKLKIAVLNISKVELGKSLEKFDDESGNMGWDQGPIFKRIFESRLDVPGGEPLGCIVGDFEFDHSPPDVKMLERMARICGAAHAPFITAAAPKLLGIKSWQQLSDPASLAAKMATADYAAWNSLRASQDSRYLSLTLPRFLARLPYGANTSPVEEFAFEEDMRPATGDGTSHDKYSWANAAYAMATNIAKSFDDTGFCVRIRGFESGGAVEGLPVHTFPTDDGGVDAKCPTEIAVTMRREGELSALGFMPLSHYAGTDYAGFVGAQTLQKAAIFNKVSATENAALSARLPYVFMVSRFAHYLKQMIYRWVGRSDMPREKAEREINEWLALYTSDKNADKEFKDSHPLSSAVVEVLEVPGKPGYFEARARLCPHIQLEGIELKLGLVSRPTGSA